MRACASASGGVMFVPDEMERETKSTKYSQFVKEEAAEKKIGVFGKKKPTVSEHAQASVA